MSAIDSIRNQFKVFDVNGDGRITFEELADVLQSSGSFNLEQIEGIFNGLDRDGNNSVHWEEFLDAFDSQSKEAEVSNSLEIKAKKAFEAFDVDGDGRITVEELKEGLHTIGINIQSERINDLFANLDQDGDGFLDYQEFVKLLNF